MAVGYFLSDLFRWQAKSRHILASVSSPGRPSRHRTPFPSIHNWCGQTVSDHAERRAADTKWPLTRGLRDLCDERETSLPTNSLKMSEVLEFLCFSFVTAWALSCSFLRSFWGIFFCRKRWRGDIFGKFKRILLLGLCLFILLGLLPLGLSQQWRSFSVYIFLCSFVLLNVLVSFQRKYHLKNPFSVCQYIYSVWIFVVKVHLELRWEQGKEQFEVSALT